MENTLFLYFLNFWKLNAGLPPPSHSLIDTAKTLIIEWNVYGIIHLVRSQNISKN